MPQGSILAPLLYIVSAHDIPTHPQTLLASFADDKTLLASHKNHTQASHILQQHLDSVYEWCTLWKVQLNNTKSQHITFTLRRQTCPPVHINNQYIPQTDTVRYLGMTLDRRLTWASHTRNTKQAITRRIKSLYSLLHPKSKLNVNQKLNIYKYLIKPIWTYGIQIYGAAKNTHNSS